MKKDKKFKKLIEKAKNLLESRNKKKSAGFESESRKYRENYMNAPAAYFTLNKTGNILNLNYAASDMLKIPNEQFKYSSIFPYLEENSKIEFARFYKKLLHSKITEYGEITFLDTDNRPIYANIKAKAYYDENTGEQQIRLKVSRQEHIKKYRRAARLDKMAIDAHKRYESIFSASGAGLALISTEGLILECNPAFAQMLEYEIRELCGKFLQTLSGSQELLNISQGRNQKRIEQSLTSKNRKTVCTDITLTEIHENNKLSYYTALIIDITARKKNEKELRKNKEWFKNVTDNSFDIINVINPNGTIIYESKSAKRILGYDNNERARKNIKDFIHPDDKQRIQQEIEQISAKPGASSTSEMRIKHARGHWLWIEANGQNCLNNPNIKGIIINSRDITPRKKAQTELIENKKLLDMFFHEAQEGFFFMMNDQPVEWNQHVDKEKALDYLFENQKITKVNDAMLRQYRAKRDDFTGLTPKDLFKHDIDQGRKSWQKLYDKGRLSIDTNEKRFDGTDIIITGNYIALYDEQNRILGHFGVQEDVTEKRQAEEALKKNEEKYRLLSENTSDSVMLFENGYIKYVSPSFFENTGYSAQEVKNISISQAMKFIFPDDVPKVKQKLSDAHKNHTTELRHEYRLKTKKGNYIWLEDLANIQYNKDGKPYRTILRSRNIHKQKEAQLIIEKQNKKLKFLNAEKDKFFNIIAHDLRSPFNTILGFSGMLAAKAETFDTQKTKKLAETLHNTAKNTFALTENLLEWARAQRGKTPFKPDKHDLLTDLTETAGLFAEQAQNKDVRLKVLNESKFIFNYDKNMVLTILRNLVSNALKYTNSGDSILIQAEKKDSRIQLSVSDTGIGMDEDTRKSLFSMGENLSRPGTKGEKGTGFGLLICKEFAKKHGGNISVESKKGKGSVFTVKLPLKQ